MTDNLRTQFSVATEPKFPVMEFLEKVLDQRMGFVRLELGTKAELGPFEGLTDKDGQFIILREDVYENAWQDDGRARFTVAHELGHYFLHTRIPMARASLERKVAPFRLSEPQANQFASELLMPRGFMRLDDTPAIVASRHATSMEAAANRIKFMKEKVWKT
ncbi:ImmA/IrrE family metallo-endopeptidase [Mesorhizobium sp. M0622]